MIALLLMTFLPPVLASIQCTLVPSVGDLLANASTGAQGGPGSGTNHTGSAVATTWYAGWHATDFPVTNVSWGKYTSVIYAFAFVAMS
jgi:chitinase